MIFLVLFALFLGALSDPLILTRYIEKKEYEAARKDSHILIDGIDMGYSAFMEIPIDTKSGKKYNNLFFWLQPCRSKKCNAKTAPFILWLQGGPGAPGTFGCLGEIGNYYIDKQLKINERCFSWCQDYNCIFVDQPTMTGKSFQLNATRQFDKKNIEYTKFSYDAMSQVYELLQQVYIIWPDFAHAPFYITGESYGGLYTANMGLVIHQKNSRKNFPKNEVKINLAGLAVGDPIINAHYQWPTYAHTLYGYGVLDTPEKHIIEDLMNEARKHLNDNCTLAFDKWNSLWNDNQALGDFLFLDFTGGNNTEMVLLGREPDEFSYLLDWMKQDKVARAMHYKDTYSNSTWEGGEVYMSMVHSGDFCMNSSWIYAKLLLEAKIDLMIYSTTMDALLGPPTTEAGVRAVFHYAEKHMGSTGKNAHEDYKAAKKRVWKVKKHDRAPAGYAKCFNPRGQKNRFCYTVLRNGGHESPAFVPREAYDLFNRFLWNRSWDRFGEDPFLPPCAPCGGVPPFAGQALPECACPKK